MDENQQPSVDKVEATIAALSHPSFGMSEVQREKVQSFLRARLTA